MANKISNILSNAKSKMEEMKTNLTNKWNDMKTAAADKFNAIKETITEKLQNAKAKALEIYQKLDAESGGKLSTMVNNVKTKFNDIYNGIKDKLNAASDFVKGAIDKIKGFFNFEWSLPKIKLPHFSISGSFSLNPPSVPSFHISWYKNGGVFDFPHLFNYGGKIGGLGEDGAEAIVPLEKNTEWLDRIAERLNRNSGQPIYLQVDGKTFGKIAVDSINDLTTQTGNLPLKFA